MNSWAKNGVYFEGNMENLWEIIMIDIPKTLSIMENLFIGVGYSS